MGDGTPSGRRAAAEWPGIVRRLASPAVFLLLALLTLGFWLKPAPFGASFRFGWARPAAAPGTVLAGDDRRAEPAPRRGSAAIPLLGFPLALTAAGLLHSMLHARGQQRQARLRAAEERQAREVLQQGWRASEARFGRLFDSVADGLLLLDARGRIGGANRAAQRLHELPLELIVGRPFEELFAPAVQARAGELRRGLEAAGAMRLELAQRRPDTPPGEVEARATELPSGGELQALVLLTEVGERRRSEESRLHLSRKVLGAQEEERSRVARELHDELGQILTALRLELGLLQKRETALHGAAETGLGRAVDMVEGAAASLRRIYRGLRPPLLDDLGLEPAVRLLVEEFSRQSGIEADLEITLETEGPAVPGEVALAAYRILQESLTNVSRHAAARSVSITLAGSLTELLLSIYDDGCGFAADDPGLRQGIGVAGMRERAGLVGGSLEIRSLLLEGTRVDFRAPLAPMNSRSER